MLDDDGCPFQVAAFDGDAAPLALAPPSLNLKLSFGRTAFFGGPGAPFSPAPLFSPDIIIKAVLTREENEGGFFVL